MDEGMNLLTEQENAIIEDEFEEDIEGVEEI
jgi:hypothetical protein